MPKFVERCRANSSNSVNEPGSSSASIRSRAVILPAACCFSTARAEPACVASCTRRSKSASFPAVVCRSTSAGTCSPARWSSAALTSLCLALPAGSFRCSLAGARYDPGSRGRSVCDVPDPDLSAVPVPERPPLDPAALSAALTAGSGLWRGVEVVGTIASTNAALVSLAAADEPEGLVLVAEHQAAGRGRLDRTWTSPARAGLTVSVLLRPDVPAARRAWVSLLTGVALAEAVSEVVRVRTSLKWPNDLLAPDGAKLAGILAESTGTAVVVGVGLNVSTRADELPGTGTSLAMVRGGPVDRAAVLLAFLRTFEQRYRRWSDVLGDPVSSGLAQDYLAWCSTVGATVTVTMPDGSTIDGVAEAVDWDGRLVVRTSAGVLELASGDVRHVRRTSQEGD